MSTDTVNSSDEMQLVTFILDQEVFGIDIMNVQEIIRIPKITAVPQAPTYVEGVTNLRGNILPVMDVRTKFGISRVDRNASNRVIVVDAGGSKVGISVDAVSEVLRVEGNCIEPAPEAVNCGDENAISGMVKVNDGKKLVMILDSARLCRIEARNPSEAVAAGAVKDTFSRMEDKQLEEVQLVSFLLGKEEFAIEIQYIREIIRYPEIVKVPNVPDYIKGVISLRDSLLPIVDLRVKLNIGDDSLQESTRIVVIDTGTVRVGLVVDKVYEVTRITKDTVFPPPPTIIGEARESLQGIARLEDGKRIIMVLDAREIVSTETIGKIEEAGDLELKNADEDMEYQDSIDEEQMVVFRLGDEQFGVTITQVQEINRLSRITKVPQAPAFVEGVVNLRGEVIPAVDLRRRFALEAKEYTGATRIIVSDINHKKIGIIVDEVMEVLRIRKKSLEESPEILQSHQAQSFIDGIANLENRMIMMLNLENILVEKEWSQLTALDENESAERVVTKSPPSRTKKNNQG